MLILFTGVVSALLIWLQIRADARLGLTAEPRADRWHSVSTPSSGGLAIFLSSAAAYCLVNSGHYPRIAWAVAALWIFGLVDDRLSFGPKLKLAVQITFAGFVVMGGAVCTLTGRYPADVLLSVLWIVIVTNAFNLIDNMDGLCAGVAVIICLFRCWLYTSEGSAANAAPYAILAAAFAGFLIFNYPPARIFMGDCGSLPLGFALAALMLVSPPPHHEGLGVCFFYPAITFAYPLFDMALVIILRVRAGRPIWVGGRDHSSHRLASWGLEQRQVVWILWLLTAIGAALGMVVYRRPAALFAAGGFLLGLLGIFGVALSRLPGYSLIRVTRRAVGA